MAQPTNQHRHAGTSKGTKPSEKKLRATPEESPKKNPKKKPKKKQATAKNPVLRGLWWLLAAPFRLAAALLSPLLLIVCLLIAAVIFLVGTESGTRQILAIVSDVTDYKISAEQIDGYLLRDITLSNVALNSPVADGEFQQLTLRWSPSSLIHRRLVLDELSVLNSELRLKPVEDTEPEEPKESAGIPDEISLPIAIVVHEINIEQLRIIPAPTSAAGAAAGAASAGKSSEEVAAAAAAELVDGDKPNEPKPGSAVEPQMPEPILIERAALRELAWEQDVSLQSLSFIGFNADATISDVQLGPRQPYPIQADLQWAYDAPDLAALSGRGQLAGDLQKITLQQSLAAPLNSELQATATSLLDNPAFDATLNLNKLRLQQIKSDLPKTTISGLFAANGQLQDGAIRYNSNGDLKLVVRELSPQLEKIPPANIKWQLSGDQGAMQLQSLRADVAGGNLSGGGTLAWQPALKTQLNLKARKFNPEPFAPDWPGMVNGDLKIAAELVDGKPTANVELTKLNGTLRGYALDGRVLAGLDKTGLLTLKRVDLRSGTAILKANGTVADIGTLDKNGKAKSPKLNVEWSIEAPDLNAVLPDARGSVGMNGRATGRLPTPEIITQLEASNIAFAGITVQTAEADIALSDKQQWQIAMNVEQLTTGSETVRKLKIGTTGGIKKHGFEIVVDADSLQAAFNADGSWQGERWQGAVTKASFEPIGLPGWELREKTSVVASPTNASAEKFCLVELKPPNPENLPLPPSNDFRSLCIAGKWSAKQGWQANVDLDKLNIEYFRSLLPPEPLIDTEFHGVITAAGTANGKITAEADLRLAAGRIEPTDDEAPTLTFGTGRIQADFSSTGGADKAGLANASITLPLGVNGKTDSGEVDANVSIALGTSKLDGRIVARMEDLSALAAVSPEIESASGQLNVNYQLAGTLQKPILNGAAKVNGGRIVLPSAGLAVSAINIALTGNPQGQLKLDGQLQSGGTLTLGGDFELTDNGPVANIALSGDDFQAINIPDARVWISPDIKLALQPGELDVTGSLTIPKAEVTPKKLPESSGGVSQSSDVIIVGIEREEAKEGLAIRIAMAVKLGDDVRFDGFGLEAKLGGSLNVKDNPDSGTSANGELVVEQGQYKAFGQDLTIDNGRIIFTGGDIGNPGLDLRATRTATDGTVAGLLVRGTVQKPSFGFYSEPSYPDDIVLAYLVTGRPPGAAGSEDNSAMNRAIAAVSQRSGDFLADKIGSRIGVEDIRFEAGDSLEQASVSIGRYLTPKLYISYGVGLFNNESVVQLRYDISRRWTLETESGTEVGGDFIYTLESE